MDAGFQWDEDKRLRNIMEHGVDFRIAAQIFANPIMEAEDRRAAYGEPRFRAVGHVGEDYYLVAYMWRGKQRRVISAWKIDDHGKRQDQAILASRPDRDE